MTYKLREPGIFSEVNGIKVNYLPLPIPFLDDHAGTFIAYHGIELHRQQGSGSDLRALMIEERKYPICTWNIDLDAGINQYCHCLRYATWHGDSVSKVALGIEVAGFTGTPETAKQLKAEQALCAAIIELVEDKTDQIIPTTSITHIGLDNYLSAKGQWPHKAVVPGSSLNENGHVDFMEGMSMAAFLRGVKALLPGAKPAPPFPGLLMMGVDSGGVLRWKQRMASKGLFRIGAENDGPHFGRGIEQATRVFQERKHLDVDGKVGPITWAAAWGQ